MWKESSRRNAVFSNREPPILPSPISSSSQKPCPLFGIQHDKTTIIWKHWMDLCSSRVEFGGPQIRYIAPGSDQSHDQVIVVRTMGRSLDFSLKVDRIESVRNQQIVSKHERWTMLNHLKMPLKQRMIGSSRIFRGASRNKWYAAWCEYVAWSQKTS